jgi:hypothetical protein
MMKRLITLAIVLLLSAGCAIGPDYRKPEIASPPAWMVDMQKAQTRRTRSGGNSSTIRC